MKLGRDYLATRFGKRTFALLIALVITPVAIATLVAVAHLQYELTEQAGLRLHRDAKEFGQAVLQRLVLIKREISYSDNWMTGQSGNRSPFRLVDAGTAARLQSKHRDFDAPYSDGSAPGKPLLAIDGPASDPGVYLVVRRSGSVLVVEVDSGFLWGRGEQLPLAHVCVSIDGSTVLYCSTPTARLLLKAAHGAASSHSVFKDVLDGSHYLGYAWDLFLQADFNSPPWRIYTFESERQALSPANSFKYLFVPAIVGLIAGTLLLGIIQIRRRLEPLNQLVTGTRRVAERDFSTRIDIHSGDEFEDLASAFNSMTQRLGTQIDTLEALSSIDKTILSSPDGQVVSTHVLKGLYELTSAAWVAIVMVDRDSPDQGRIQYIYRASGEVETRRISMNLEEIPWNRYQHGLDVALDAPGLAFLETVRDQGASSCFAIPFFSNDQLDGILCLGFPDAVDLDDEAHATLEGFADRLAVATAAEKKERLLQQQANFDALTGLPNRFLFKDRLERALIHARRERQTIAVLFLDLDRFKTVNDTLGHSLGDRLLVEAAGRLARCIGENDSLARLGGDEFVILVSEETSINAVVHTARRILASFAQPFSLDEREVLVGTSIGIAIFPQDGNDSEELLRNADTAMYATKERGRGSYYFFDQSMNRRLKERARTESDLWRAVRDNEFELWYQPQLDLNDGRVCGVEALLRWRHPDRGVVGPAQFVPLAEELGLIEMIGSHALEMACRQYALWLDQGLALDRVAVNVSPREFRQEDYVTRVHDVLKEFGMPPLRLTLEITENLLIQDTDMVRERLQRLKEAGVSFSIDDFGIGYSSLAYLQKLPIDTLKIDGSFIRGVASSKESAAIVSAILDMATRLDIGVIAEGVETDEQLAFLRECGCPQIQGYIYSRPLHADELLAFARVGAIDSPDSAGVL